MTAQATQVLQDALALTVEEQAILVDELLLRLHRPDLEREKQWVWEAKDRLNAYLAGEIEAIPAEEVFRALKQR